MEKKNSGTFFKKITKDLINRLGAAYLEKEGNDNNINNKSINKTYNIIQILKFKSQRKIFIKITIISVGCSYNYYGIILTN